MKSRSSLGASDGPVLIKPLALTQDSSEEQWECLVSYVLVYTVIQKWTSVALLAQHPIPLLLEQHPDFP